MIKQTHEIIPDWLGMIKQTHEIIPDWLGMTKQRYSSQPAGKTVAAQETRFPPRHSAAS